MNMYLSDKIYLPESNIDTAELEDMFTHSIFNAKACSKCECLDDRPKIPEEGDICYSCPAYTGTYKLASYTRIDGTDYIGLPIGARRKISKVVNFKEFQIVDQRIKTPFKHKGIKITAKLWDYQHKPVNDMTEKKYGILEAKPRAGKTLMFSAIMCNLGMKTLILASQKDWLDQFYETICGGPGVKPMTNVPELEEKYGKQICGFARKLEDFKKLDIALCTYQIFLHNKDLLKEVTKLFGLVGVDEVHGTGADEFSKVLNKFEAYSRIGLTATPDRKDTKEILTYDIVGPVQTVADVEQLKPTVNFIRTGFAKDYKVWHYMQSGLAKDQERNRLIVNLVMKALKRGYNVVIPVTLKNHMTTLVDLINTEYGREVALPFHGQLRKDVRRNTILEARKAKKVRVIVGIRSLVQTGINVPSWNCLIEVMPISNTPKLKQESSRILTKIEGKKPPVILQLVDDSSIPKACLRRCIADYKSFEYIIPKKQWEIVTPYMRATRHKQGEYYEENTVGTKTEYTKKLFTKRQF